MAENTELDAFVKAGRPADEPAAEPKPKQDAAAPVESTPTEPPLEPEDAEPPAPREGEPAVPRRALEDERHKRQSWVERAARAEAERDAIAKQLEELKRPQAQPQQAQPAYQAPMPDPQMDPHGFAQAMLVRQQQAQLNDRLNMSELMLREKIGPEKVAEYVDEFKQLAADDPTLSQKLYSQPHPYAWLQQEVDRLRLVRDVGSDPAAYEAKLRAKWEAERGEEPPPIPVSPAAGMAPSLATARSVGGRSAPAWTGPRPIDQILQRR